MLDIKQLNDKFDEILSSFTEEKVQQWIDFANERDLVERLLRGESIDIVLDKVNPKYVSTNRIVAKYSNAGENNYALAA
jgi:hypothetical protein